MGKGRRKGGGQAAGLRVVTQLDGLSQQSLGCEAILVYTLACKTKTALMVGCPGLYQIVVLSESPIY